MLSPATITFELQAKVVEEIYLELCSYGQYSEVQMLRDLDLDLLSGRRQAGGNTRSRSTHIPNLIEIEKKTFCGRAQRDGRPAEYRWHLLFNAAKYG